VVLASPVGAALTCGASGLLRQHLSAVYLARVSVVCCLSWITRSASYGVHHLDDGVCVLCDGGCAERARVLCALWEADLTAFLGWPVHVGSSELRSARCQWPEPGWAMYTVVALVKEGLYATRFRV
jgi:hypothetical protein